MNTAELKLKIFREVDALEKNRLEEFYGLLINYVNGQKEMADWDKLSDIQRQGIYDAMNEMAEDNGILHEDLMVKYRNKYSHD